MGEYEYEGVGAEDLSASSTLVHFDRPMPLLRVPLLAGASDDPSAGPFVLAFRDADSWRAAFRSTEAKVVEQCEVSISLPVPRFDSFLVLEDGG